MEALVNTFRIYVNGIFQAASAIEQPEDEAAKKIQAIVRGRLLRKQVFQVEEELQGEISGDFVQFSVDDLLFLERREIGLRHVTGEKRAKDEFFDREDFKGDALAISTLRHLIKYITKFNDEESLHWSEHYRRKNLNCLIEDNRIDDLKISELIDSYESRLLSFISRSLEWDLSGQLNPTDSISDRIRAALKSLEKNTFFIIGNFSGAKWGKDKSNYHGIGKVGKKWLNTYRYTRLIKFKERVDFSEATDIREFSREVSKAILKDIIIQIKKMRIYNEHFG